MTHFLNHYILKYTPLSPIHIGTGDSYEPTNYIIDDGTLYEFDTGGAMAALTAQDRDDLDKITKGKPDTHLLKDVQRFFYSRREALKPWAVNAIPVLDGVANLYANRVGQTANQEKGGEQAINRLEIDRTAYNPITRQPVLFGSSVKGAIRTALLDKVNNKQRASEPKGLHEFQGRLLKYRHIERGHLQLELDPLRLVSIGDAAWQNKADKPTSQVYLAVNRKKSPVKDEHGNIRQALGENLYQILECVPAFYAHTFVGQLTLQNVGTESHPKLPAAEFRYSAAAIANACNKFYNPIFSKEIKLLIDRGYLDENWKKTAAQLFKLIDEKRKTNQAFLLRVGRHSGAESLTLEGVRNIKIMKGKGQQPEYSDAAKTLWLAAQHKDQRTDLLPFGWVLVEILPGNTADQEWPELAELCAHQQQSALAWVKRQAAQKASLEQKRQEAKQRREREKLEQHQKAEQRSQAEKERLANESAEQQRQAEAQKQREKMTEEQRLIDDLRNQLQEKTAKKLREQIGGPLYGDLKKIIDQAKNWEAKDKASLKQLGEQILVYLNVKNKKIREILHDLEQ